MKKIILAIIFTSLFSTCYARGLTMSSGILDYSDDQKRSGFLDATFVFGDNNGDGFVGKFTPITGAMITQDDATMLYAGVKGNFTLGNFFISPSFAPGYYDMGNGKDLGSFLEFKSQINFGWQLKDKSNLGLSYSHISNADLGNKNPGANNLAFTFLKKY